MNTQENQPQAEKVTNGNGVTIPAEAKPIIDKMESQIPEIIKGFNQVLQDNGLSEATIGDFHYIIEIPISQKPTTVRPDMKSRTNGERLSGDDIKLNSTLEMKMCKVSDGKGGTTWKPC
ncbi:hypothetical protein [Dolichospermum flos-aquae]|jgi:hypothetical protein|uniref:Uncharacterized protein n=1 Tax=Dolichospermum flos-aquae LEGE 04289 TaxID=1828708 RepID=A0ACC5Q437_DOLFA|nr:hypothetical protein [Dolichospermum flos-aquae]MBE9219689.1 hypothetical protein [Dolichospermum flos-aquae LEGE 04289]